MAKDRIRQEWEATERYIRNTGRTGRLFKLDKDKTAMVVVDMQNRFVDPKAALGVPSARGIVPNINALTKACRSVTIPVIWLASKRRYDIEAGLIAVLQPKSPMGNQRSSVFEEAMWEDDGVKIWPELDIDPEKDYEIVKYRYSAFIPGSSHLERVLRALGKDTLIIVGTVTNVCVAATVMDAMMLDFKVIVVSDGTAAVTDFLQQSCLMSLKMVFADVTTTDDLLTEIKGLK